MVRDAHAHKLRDDRLTNCRLALQAACQRLEKAGVSFQKKLSDGRMRHIAFVLDPDSYWVEASMTLFLKTLVMKLLMREKLTAA